MQKEKKADSHAAKPNWKKIKKEYITSDVSLRELSRKYGVPISTMHGHCKKEGWEKVCERIEEMAEQKIIEAVSDKRASNAEKAQDIINSLMDKISESMQVIKPGDIGAIKQVVGSIKDLKDMGVFDLETDDQTVQIVLGSEADKYAD